jgi:hypothetical protein
LFKDMTMEQAGFVLTTLLLPSQVNYRMEEVLNEIAKYWPTKVVDLLGERVRVDRQSADRYEAIPYEFHMLQGPLQTHPGYVVTSVRSWFEEDREYFATRGGRLLANVFPSVTGEYEHCLRRLIDDGGRVNLEFLVEVLGSYTGESSLHDVAPSDHRYAAGGGPVTGSDCHRPRGNRLPARRIRTDRGKQAL